MIDNLSDKLYNLFHDRIHVEYFKRYNNDVLNKIESGLRINFLTDFGLYDELYNKTVMNYFSKKKLNKSLKKHKYNNRFLIKYSK